MDDASEDYEMASESQDRLSELPLSLIFHILSFLPMKDVVWTSILSKRWKDLWTTVPCLYFYDELEAEDLPNVEIIRNFRNFINGALLFWRGAKILKFKIVLDGLSMPLANDIDLWVIFAKKYKVEELNIDLSYYTFDWDDAVEDSKRDIYIAPQCLNSCSSIKVLTLVGYNLRIPEPPLWNQLTSLTIKGFCLSECLIHRVLSGTPKLEVFNLRLLESNENLNIHSRSLKKLKIEKYLYFHYDKPSTTSVLRIECPNLEMFEILGLLYSKCVLKNVSSLTDVTLGFHFSRQYDNDGLSGEQLLGETLRQIVPALHNVKRITLSEWCVQVLGAIRSKHFLSPLSNVEFLKLTVGVIELDKMVDLLGSFSKLKILAIKHLGYKFTGQQQYVMEQNAGENDLEPESNIPISFLLQLRTVEITLIFLKPLSPIFLFIEFVLKHATMLERIAIRDVGWTPESPWAAAKEKLLSMPRSSPTAKTISLFYLLVHQTEIRTEGFRTLREGQRVEFKVDTGEDGRSKAVDVSIIARSFSPGGRRGGGDGYGRGGDGGRGGRYGGGYGGGRGGDGV